MKMQIQTMVVALVILIWQKMQLVLMEQTIISTRSFFRSQLYPQSNAFSLNLLDKKTESYGTIYSFGASNDVNQTQVKLVVRQDNGGIEVNIGRG